MTSAGRRQDGIKAVYENFVKKKDLSDQSRIIEVEESQVACDAGRDVNTMWCL